MSESNGDCLQNEDTSITGTVRNTLEENIMNVSNGDSSLEQDTTIRLALLETNLKKLLQMKVMCLLERN